MKDEQFNILIKTLSDNSMNYGDYIQLILVIITLIIGFQSIFNIYDKYILPFFNKIKNKYNKIKKYFIDKKNNKLTFKKLQKLQNLIKDYPYYYNKFIILCYNNNNNCFYDLTYKNYKKYRNIYICIDPQNYIKYYKSTQSVCLDITIVNKLYYHTDYENFDLVYDIQNLIKRDNNFDLKKTHRVSKTPPCEIIEF